jgi:hypothetical protein
VAGCVNTKQAEVFGAEQHHEKRYGQSDMKPPHNDSIWPDDTRRAAVTVALAAAPTATCSSKT